MKIVFLALLLVLAAPGAFAQTAWQASLDSNVNFYQTTELGIVVVGTQKSVYGIDGRTGERLWRRAAKVNETGVAQVPGTDLVLLSLDLGSKSRLEAIDIVSGERLWRSEKVKGDVMQLAADPQTDVLAVVLVKDPRGGSGGTFKRKPIVNALRLSDGDELWKRELDSTIEMMPVSFSGGDADHTLDNYRAPLLVDGRLFLFYEGATSYDASTGKEKEREKFKVNEEGLALTEADPIVDENFVYTSGRGRIRAVDRRTGEVRWKSDDLGTAAEMLLIDGTIYVRSGGRFTRISDGEPREKGPFGVSAIDAATGKTIWRYKGADKGLTNFVFVDRSTIALADRDDLITLDAGTGKRRSRRSHKTDDAQFVLVNESGMAVVGGRNEIAAFDPADPKRAEVWRARHTAPGRGVFRTVAGIALRAASLYFRYGGIATTGFGLVRGGLNLASGANAFRWSGLRTRFGSLDLTTLASNAVRGEITRRIYAYGALARTAGLAGRAGGIEVIIPSGIL